MKNRGNEGHQGLSAMEASCPVCGSGDLQSFLTLENLPAQDGVVWPTADEAMSAPTGDVDLFFCANCSYIWNAAYDPSVVEFTRYDFSLHYSPLYEDFIQQLAQDLVNRWGLKYKSVLEIGCGQGHFLRRLCSLGQNRGIGIDPSYISGTHTEEMFPAIVFHRDYFSAKYVNVKADLVVCRHVIDELNNPKVLLEDIRLLLKQRDNSVAYFEVPNPLYTFANGIIWNVGYAKHAWFTPTALTYLLENCGFRVLRAQETHGNEYLSLEAVADMPAPLSQHERRAAADETWATIKRFRQDAATLVSLWETRVAALKARHARVAVWGAGQRCINFLNHFDLRDEIAFVIDINPRRQGMFLPRTGYSIEPPELLLECPPDTILITNPTYSKEIKAQTEALGLHPDFLEL